MLLCFVMVDKAMGSKLVVKDNALIEASYSLGTVEQRILLLAILVARENNTTIEMGKALTIHASKYAEVFNVDKKAGYEALKSGVQGLADAPSFGYRVKDKVVYSNWVDTIAYIDNKAVIEVIFTTKVVAFISELEKRFTSYDISQVAHLKNRYAIRLYESLIQYRGTGKLNISLNDLRLRLGLLENEYYQMAMFKVRVLDLAINQINEHTDIKASYEQHKEGRSITGFTFTFKEKPKPKAKGGEVNRDDKTGDLFSIGGLSDAQLARIARNKQFIADYNHMITPQSNANNDTNEWVRVMVARLKTSPNDFNKRPISEYLN